MDSASAVSSAVSKNFIVGRTNALVGMIVAGVHCNFITCEV